MTDSFPQSRNCTHNHCQTQTEVAGSKFAALSNPLADVKETFCAQCGDKYSIDNFVWSDTGESIATYHQRHGKASTETDTFICSMPGLFFSVGLGGFIGVMAGAVICFTMRNLLAVILAVVFGIVGAAAGAFIREKILVPGIIQRVCGVTDTRMLK